MPSLSLRDAKSGCIGLNCHSFVKVDFIYIRIYNLYGNLPLPIMEEVMDATYALIDELRTKILFDSIRLRLVREISFLCAAIIGWGLNSLLTR